MSLFNFKKQWISALVVLFLTTVMFSCSSDDAPSVKHQNNSKELVLESAKYQTISSKTTKKIDFSLLNQGDQVGVSFANPNARSTQDIKPPYYFERTEFGLKLVVNPTLLKKPLKIYDSQGNLYKTVEPATGNGTEYKENSWIIGAIILCCVEAEVGSDGWKVRFDCDCLE